MSVATSEKCAAFNKPVSSLRMCKHLLRAQSILARDLNFTPHRVYIRVIYGICEFHVSIGFAGQTVEHYNYSDMLHITMIRMREAS